jgi:uncharacterized RDD family membrane protein YckC
MRCQQCQAEAPRGASYCHSCGQQLQPRCATCDTLNPAGSNFCFSCGNRLAHEETPFSTQSAAEAATAAPSAPVCPRCYESNEPDSAYCFACGLPLDDEAVPANTHFGQIPAFSVGRPAGFWIRVLAYIIDGILLTALFALVWPILSGEAITDYWQSTDVFAAGDFFSLALNLVYYTGAIAIWSTTLGKRPFRLYVVRTDGSRVSPGRALARYLAYFLSAFTLGIGFIMVGLRQDKRGLHDLVCDTVVIQR